MRAAITLSLLVGLLAMAGCNKPKPPQTTSVAPPPSDTAVVNPETTGPLTPVQPLPPPGGSTLPPYPGATAGTPPYPSGTEVATPAPPMGGGKTYDVRPGDTMYKIMREQYGQANKALLGKIVAANPGLDPDHIKAGQKINLPPQ